MKKRILLTTAFVVALGVGIAVGAHHEQKALKVEAATTTSRLIAKLGNIGKWSENNAKLCAYLTDDTHTYWTSLQTLSSDKAMYAFEYAVTFTPTKLIWVRMDPAATAGNWGQKWNQTGDLALADATYLQDEWNPSAAQCNQWTVRGDVYTSSSWATPKVSFNVSTVEIVNGNEPQVSGKVTLALNEEFKVANAADGVWSGFYDCPSALDSAFSGGSKEQLDGSGNIKCLIPGTYDFYFNTETKKIWISRQDIVDADGWASYFLDNVGCDSTGVNLPTGWNLCKTAYNNLSNDAKDYVYAGKADKDGDNLGRALARYEVAVKNHSSLEKFIKNSGGTVRPVSANYGSANIESESNDSMILIIVIASISAISLATLLVIKKRKHQ